MRSFIVHGHFYQPPREDPISGLIPDEPGASPFPNWNEKIYTECYRPNAVLGNFERISFNMGPTLISWLHRRDREIMRLIIAQDQANVRRFGVGNAFAQPFHHTILPLATQQDKEIQVAWGVADFIHHFGRQPEGMWLPEAAVDTETLVILARHGIKYIILAPWQSEEPQLDVTEPYQVHLPGQQKITVFFYQGDLSARISFEPQATVNADHFVEQQLLKAYSPLKSRAGMPQVVTLASDGELYGHHQNLRDHFLKRLVDGASNRLDIRTVFPGLWLRAYPAVRSTRIRDNTSWSCHHGVKRWQGGCACSPGGGDWKTGLRQAFDHLAEILDDLYLDIARPWIADTERLRGRYIEFLHGQLSLPQLIQAEANQALPAQTLRRLELMLMSQYERQRMYTSCGWFFEDFDRIEPRNNVAYAAHAVHLAQEASGIDLASDMAMALEAVISPRTRRSAGKIFNEYLLRAAVRSRGDKLPLTQVQTRKMEAPT